jgi:hypothetical protein
MRSKSGNSEIVSVGVQNGLDVMEMAPKPGKSPKRKVEVIDVTGNVTVLEYDVHTADWMYHLQESGRIVVAALEGPGAVPVEYWVDAAGNKFRYATPKATTAMGAEIERVRAEHGYQVFRDKLGRFGIEVTDADSEIAQRRARARAVLERQKASRPANRMNLSDAAAMLAGQQAPNAEVAQLRAQVEAQNAKINELLAALGGGTSGRKAAKEA